MEWDGPVAEGCRPEDQREQEEEHARDLEPEDSADAAEGAQEAADSLDHAARGFAGGVACSAGLGGSVGALRAGLAGRGLRAGCDPLPGHASGNAESDTEGAANRLRLHFDIDGNSQEFGTALVGFLGPRGC